MLGADAGFAVAEHDQVKSRVDARVVLAPHDGVVKEITVRAGQRVEAGKVVAAVAEGNERLKAFDTSCFSGEYITALADGYLGELAEARSDAAKQERRKAS